MPADTVLEGYNSWSGGFNLNGHTLTIGNGGIIIYENFGFPKIYGSGGITSSTSSLNFNFRNNNHLMNGYVIESIITNHRYHTVGLTISGGLPGHKTHVDLTGSQSNTFTGDVYISRLGGLQIYKRNGALAVRGNIYVSDGGYLILSGSNQISDSSIIQLDGRRRSSTLYFSFLYNSNVSEKVSHLEVKGAGVVDYQYWHAVGYDRGKQYLYLDGLEIYNGGYLTIKNWQFGRDHLLVRKDSAHLYDALTRIKFEGYWEWRAALKSYNKDYWQLIPGIPEPSTYGAILIGLGMCAGLMRSKSKGTHSGV